MRLSQSAFNINGMAQLLKLNERQMAFVDCYVSTGGRNATQAAIAAGYPKPGAHTAASRMLRLPHILDAIKKRTEQELKAGVAVGVSVLYHLATEAKSEATQLAAALALLDRGGLAAVNRSEHRHVIEDRRTDDELRAHVANLQRQLGLSAKVIEHQPLPVCDQRDVIDVETLEPEPTSEAQPADIDTVEGDAVPGDEADPFD